MQKRITIALLKIILGHTNQKPTYDFLLVNNTNTSSLAPLPSYRDIGCLS